MKTRLDYIDEKTGELHEGRPDVPFRSITDLKCYSDIETEFGESVVDTDGYEDINSIIQRILRLPKGRGRDLLDALASEVIDQNISDDEAEQLLDDDTPDLSDISDLTDISQATEYLSSVAANSNSQQADVLTAAPVGEQSDRASVKSEADA